MGSVGDEATQGYDYRLNGIRHLAEEVRQESKLILAFNTRPGGEISFGHLGCGERQTFEGGAEPTADPYPNGSAQFPFHFLLCRWDHLPEN